MKKELLAIAFLLCNSVTHAEPTMYAYKVTVGENGITAAGVTAEGRALPVSVTRGQKFSCKLKDVLGQEQTLSMTEAAGTSITIIPIEKHDDAVKTALHISETSGSSAATQLSADCSFPEGASTSATISKVAVLALGKPQSFTLPNGSTVTITAALAP